MREITNDAFYDHIKHFDRDDEYHIVGEVDYHLLQHDALYEGLRSHREALIAVFDQLVENSLGDHRSPLIYDIDKARATPLDPKDFFYCPNIVSIDYYGNVSYDAEWRPNDENFGTTVPYWYALMEPVQGRRNKPEDFDEVNKALFPKGTALLDIYEWTTDWSDLFDAGHEWYGACCWSIYDGSMNRYVVLLVSATD